MAEPQVRVLSTKTIIFSAHSDLTLILYKPLSGASSITSEEFDNINDTEAQLLPGRGEEDKYKDFEERDEIRMLVSSKVMAECSKVFKAMLSVNFADGTELAKEGSAVITLPEDNPISFIPLLHLLHSHSPLVPKRLALGELIEVAILVDKYEMGDSVKEFAGKFWAENIEGVDGFGFRKESDVVGTLFVTFVLRMEAEFEPAVRWSVFRLSEREFERYVRESEEELGFSLPGRMIESINLARRRIIDIIFSFLRVWFHHFPASGTQCRHANPNCDALFIDTLLLSASKHGLWPPPSDGLMLESQPRDLIDKVERLEVKTLCSLTCEDLHEGWVARSSFSGVWGMVEMEKMVTKVKEWEVVVKEKPIAMSWYFMSKK